MSTSSPSAGPAPGPPFAESTCGSVARNSRMRSFRLRSIFPNAPRSSSASGQPGMASTSARLR
jgi:hypothetical protein